MLWAMLVIGLLPVLALTVQSLHCAHEGLVALQQRQLTLTLEQSRDRLSAWLEAQGNLLRLVSLCPGVRGTMPASGAQPADSVISFLDQVVLAQPALDSLMVVDADWHPIAQPTGHTHTAAELVDKEMRTRLAAADSVVWDEHYHLHDDHAMGMHMGCPIRDDTGRIVGYVLANLELQQALASLHQPHTIATTAKVYLVDSTDGRYLSLPPDAAAQVGNPSHLPHTVLHGHGQAHGGHMMLPEYTDFRGKTVIGKALAMPDVNWTLIAEIDRREAFDLIYFLLRRASYMGAFVCFVIVVLAMLSARRLSAPLHQLTLACRQIASGSTQYRLSELPSREANEVAMSFNGMLDRLGEMQRQLVQAGALAAVGELSASIVHEMRNPLNTIQINLTALRRRVQDDDKYLELYQLAERQTGRLQEMLNDLLNYGKPLALQMTPCDVGALVQEVAAEFQRTAAAAGVSIHVQSCTPPPRAELDREQMHRALSNLVENALQATPAGGTITITTAVAGRDWTLSVQDTGPGVTEAMRERIFLPFFTTRPDGTGLGLANVRKIVQLHQGEITIGQSEAGGARFTMRFPRAPETLHESPVSHR